MNERSVVTKLITDAGLTEGEAKVYLALLRTGESTTGPIIEQSGVANSIASRILKSLIDKGLVSFIIREKRHHYQAAPPQRILDYIEERKAQLEKSKNEINNLIPQLTAIGTPKGSTITVYKGFKGYQTAWELQYQTLQQGDEYHSYGVYAVQEERFHLYWQRDHQRRIEKGIKGKILFNQGTDEKVVKNRNSYEGCEARYMPVPIETPAWFTVWKNTVAIGLQEDELVVIIIVNALIAQTFEAYFKELWEKSVPFMKA